MAYSLATWLRIQDLIINDERRASNHNVQPITYIVESIPIFQRYRILYFPISDRGRTLKSNKKKIYLDS